MFNSLKYWCFGLGLMVSVSTLACSPPLEEPDYLAESDLVFVGEVIQAGKFKSNLQMMGIDFAVLFSIKGDDLEKVRIRSNVGGAACGYNSSKTFSPGSYWLMYANEDGEVYRTSTLSGNQMFEDMNQAVLEAESLLATSFLDMALEETIDEPADPLDIDLFMPPVDDFPMVADMPPVMSNTCKVEFDGCNSCVYDQVSGNQDCTVAQCEMPPLAAPVCLIYFDEMPNFMEHGPFYLNHTEDSNLPEMPEMPDMTDMADWPIESEMPEVPEFIDLGFTPIPQLNEEDMADLMENVPGMVSPDQAPNIQSSVNDRDNQFRNLMTSLIFWN